MPLNEEEQKIIDDFNNEHGDLLQRYFQPISDKRIAQALKTHDAKNLTVMGAFERLQKIEQAANEKIRKIELEKLVMRKCIDRGINYRFVEDLGLTFENLHDIDTKLKLLAEAQAKQHEANLNEYAIRSSFKPGGGITNREFNSDREKMISEYRSHLPASDRAALEKLSK